MNTIEIKDIKMILMTKSIPTTLHYKRHYVK